MFRHHGKWCYAALDYDGFDHDVILGAVGVTDDASDDEVRAEMLQQFPYAELARVPDAD